MADMPDPKTESSAEYFERLDAALSSLNSAPQVPRAFAADIPPPAPGVVAETFAALVVTDDAAPAVKPLRLVADAEPRITDAFIEEVTRRVVERLAPDAVRAVVVDVVSEVAERLVTEEIARIRKDPNG